jgi:glutamate formiminotransferase
VTTLLAYPNVSEGRDTAAIASIAAAFGPALLDAHTDPDHHRTAFTLAGSPGELAEHVLRGAARAVALIDLARHQGVHPRVGAIDVAPIIYLRDGERGAACAEALVLADLLAERLRLPVFLYGALAGGRTRAQLRRGGPDELSRRIAVGELHPDFGPGQLSPRTGAVLVAARPPLLAFNLELESSVGLPRAQEIAALIREGGAEGLPGVRAIGVWLARRGRAQVSTNVEDHAAVTAADVVAAVRRHAGIDAAELVGLAPDAALVGFPADVPLRGRATIEESLRARPGTA